MPDLLARRPVLLVNPVSGRGEGHRLAARAAEALRRHGLEAPLHLTDHEGHAADLAARAAAGGADLILVVGGDGTLRDVAAGLAGAPTAVALLPAGTGNDLAGALRLPRAPAAAVETALHGRERLLDVWLWNELPFVNAAGVGLDAAVAAAINTRPARRGRLRAGGMAAYLLALARVLRTFRPLRGRLSAGDAGWEGAAWLIAFAGGPTYGGGLRIAPGAVPDDGLLEIVIVGDVSRAELVCNLPGLLRGTHVRHPRVQVLRASRAELTLEAESVARAGLATLDGEVIGALPATIRRAPYPLRLRVPPGAAVHPEEPR
jgi:diacylglycerol kinase (ATP)